MKFIPILAVCIVCTLTKVYAQTLPAINVNKIDFSNFSRIQYEKDISLPAIESSFTTARVVCQAGGCSALPLQLLSFDGKTIGTLNHLFWKTTNEINSSHFEIERSPDGTDFTAIGHIAAINSSGKQQYVFDDAYPFTGNNYYRLRIVDIDQKFRFSNIILLRNKNDEPVVLAPNPATDRISITVFMQREQKATLHIRDMQGRMILTMEARLQKGNNILQVNISSLAAGSYLVNLFYKETKENTRLRFIKQ